LQSFVALLVVILALSLVSQGLLNDLFSGDQTSILRIISTIAGGIFGLMIGASIVAGGMFYHWAKNNFFLRMLRWGLFLGVIPIALAIFGNFVPALIILIGTFITVGILYAVLWGVIWAAGGGSLADFLPGGLVFLVPIFWPFIPLILVVWLLGQVIQRVTFVDMKIAMRSMLATKARGASMLLALVIGVFTLSFLVMLVTTFRDRLEELLIDQAGGNVFVFLFSEDPEADVALERALTTVDGVNSYTLINSYQTELAYFTDVSAGNDVVSAGTIRRRLDEELGEDADFDEEIIEQLDGRGIESNLPSGDFDKGRQLRSSDLDREIPALVIPDNEFTRAAGFEAGDIVTLYIISNADERVRTNPIDFEIVGMRSEPEGLDAELASSDFYVPRESLLAAIEANTFPGEFVTAEQRFAVADVDEDSISELREEIGLTFAFVFETRLFFDLINRIIDQFTTWPIIVTGTALLTGFIVIANAVALTTMERRREIAIMKAVGLARWRVLGMLILENTLIGLIGGLIGVGMAALLLFLTLTIVFEGVFGEVIPYTTALGLMLMCVGITIIAALLSVWNASGEKPLNVLRYE
jgi:cell division protein FtsX